MRDSKRGRIGISIGCWLPWPLLPVIGLPLAAVWTRWIGCTFWQMLPLRGAFRIVLKLIGFPITFAERAWNPIKWRDQLRGKRSPQGTKAYPKDWVFFPDPDTSRERFEMVIRETGALPISHHLYEAKRWGGLVEVYPGLEKTADYLAKYAAGVGRELFVIDTKHLRRPGEDGESLLWPWQEALETLLPHTALVHFQPMDGEELLRTLDGETTELTQILLYLQGRYDGPFLIEVPPDILGPTYYLNPLRMIRTLREVRELIEAYI